MRNNHNNFEWEEFVSRETRKKGGPGNLWKGFRLMIAFFTRIPVGIPDYSENLFASGIKSLPFVGLLIGMILWLVSFGHMLGLPDSVAALLLIIAYCLVTGGLHFDGVADTCDGIFSGTSREQTLEIMRDSRNGTFAVVGIVLLLLSYFVFFREVGSISPEVLLCMPIVGKCGMIVGAFKANPARESGLGYGFIKYVNWPELVVALVTMTVFCILLAPISFLSAAASLLFALAMREGFQKRLGGQTGDTLGFVCEITQVIYLIGTYLTYAAIG